MPMGMGDHHPQICLSQKGQVHHDELLRIVAAEPVSLQQEEHLEWSHADPLRLLRQRAICCHCELLPTCRRP